MKTDLFTKVKKELLTGLRKDASINPFLRKLAESGVINIEEIHSKVIAPEISTYYECILNEIVNNFGNAGKDAFHEIIGDVLHGNYIRQNIVCYE